MNELQKFIFTQDSDRLYFLCFLQFGTRVFTNNKVVEFATNAAEYAAAFLFHHLFRLTSFKLGESAGK